MYQKDFGSIVIFNKLNAGCGPDLINDEGWLNVDNHFSGVADNFRLWDITTSPTELEHDLTERFDFILVNHVLCTMNPYQVHQALINLHRCLKPGGRLQVIDMDLLKVIQSFQDGRYDDIPIEEGDPHEKLCYAISGYGTRKSLFTTHSLYLELQRAGFRSVIWNAKDSEYDTRPKESLVIEADK